MQHTHDIKFDPLHSVLYSPSDTQRAFRHTFIMEQHSKTHPTHITQKPFTWHFVCCAESPIILITLREVIEWGSVSVCLCACVWVFMCVWPHFSPAQCVKGELPGSGSREAVQVGGCCCADACQCFWGLKSPQVRSQGLAEEEDMEGEVRVQFRSWSVSAGVICVSVEEQCAVMCSRTSELFEGNVFYTF